MLSVLLVAVLGASEPVRLASTRFTCEGVSETLCEAYLDRFVAALGSGGQVKITTQRDIAEVLGVERQKQLLGCGDDASSCMAELAEALGVDGVVVGSISLTATTYLLNLKLLRARDGSRWHSQSRRVDLDEAELLQALDSAAGELRVVLGGGTVPRAIPWSLFGAGAAVSVVGAVLYGLSKADAAALRSTSPQSPMEISATASRGAALQPAGIALFCVGIPFMVAGLVWLIWGPR